MRRDQTVEQQQQGQETKQSWADKLGEWIKDNHAQQPGLGSELKAMGREGVKDVRNSVHQVFFGQREGPGEPAPLNHTQAEISQERGVVEGYKAIVDEYAARGSVHGQNREQEHGIGR